MNVKRAVASLCVTTAVLLADFASAQTTVRAERLPSLNLRKASRLSRAVVVPHNVRDDERPYRGGAPVRSTPADSFERAQGARLTPPPLARSFAAETSTAISPGDAAGAVGPVQLVSSTNASFVVYDRSGARLLQVTQDQFWIGEENADDVFFDPRIAYDAQSGRWVAIALHGSISSEEGGADALMVAASTTSDATGSWVRYRLSNRSLDFTRLALTRDTIMAGTRFGGSDDFLIFSIDKAALYPGPRELSARRYFGTPADIVPVDARDESVEYVVATTARSILLNRLDRLDQPWLEFATDETSVSIESPPAPQAGTSQHLDTGYDDVYVAMMHGGRIYAARVMVLETGGTRRSSVLWAILDPDKPAAIRYGLVDDPSGTKWYAYPSLAVNGNGDLFLTFASFSESQFASAEYIYVNAAGIPSTPALIKAGEAAVVNTSRWGDYTTTIVDPVNRRDFWTLQMYATQDNSWGTWWANLTLSPPKRRAARK